MFSLVHAGQTKTAQAFDVFTRRGAFAGIVVENYGRHTEVYFNMAATKGSKRKFSGVQDALAFIKQRRVKKGWGV
jgi:hypothetical protein